MTGYQASKTEQSLFDSYLETTLPHSLKCQHSYYGQKVEEMVLAETLTGSVEQWHVHYLFIFNEILI